jgi:hypothetical protein
MVIVEELGKENLEEYWRKRADHLGPFRKRGDEIMDVLWDMLLALQEFHEEAYHLDFKPKNQ